MTTASLSPVSASLSGSVLVLIQFDVCEELRLDQLQRTISARTVQQPSMKHLASLTSVLGNTKMVLFSM